MTWHSGKTLLCTLMAQGSLESKKIKIAFFVDPSFLSHYLCPEHHNQHNNSNTHLVHFFLRIINILCIS